MPSDKGRFFPPTKTMKAAMKKHQEELNKEEKQRLFQYDYLMRTTRAGKLLKKGKPFVVVAIDEPYYPEVYRMIRQQEKRIERWTEDDEKEFQLAIKEWADWGQD